MTPETPSLLADAVRDAADIPRYGTPGGCDLPPQPRRRTATDPQRHRLTCPAGHPVASLLDSCNDPDCLRRDIAADKAYARSMP